MKVETQFSELCINNTQHKNYFFKGITLHNKTFFMHFWENSTSLQSGKMS